MHIDYINNKVKDICNIIHLATKKLGHDNARKLFTRLQQIEASESIEYMIKYRIGRCHPLHNDLRGRYALDLEHPYRLIIEPVVDDEYLPNEQKIKSDRVIIIGVVNYHDGKNEWLFP